LSDCKLSIVTVCYNAEQTIEDTILSILNQTYNDFEYIIVDGNSTDGTNDIIKKFLPDFAKKGVVVKYISEPDDGIYYAMNKGIDMAEGEWIAFMNADDSYYDSTTLSQIFAKQYDGYDVLYGSANLITEQEARIEKPYPLEELATHMVFSHQSSFVRTEIAKIKKYDTSYELASDYQFFLELWLERKRFCCLENMVVSNFAFMGNSRVRAYQSCLELKKIRCMHDIPGCTKIEKWLDYWWHIVVHLGGARDMKINRNSKGN
jgi:glycosyltransferase involved in cell wall biosynthesis